MIVLQKAEPERTPQDSHLKPSKTNYLIQKKESITRLHLHLACKDDWCALVDPLV